MNYPYLGPLPDKCDCNIEQIDVTTIGSMYSKYAYSSSCSKCYGTQVNLMDWNIAPWINKDTYKVLLAEYKTWEDHTTHAVRVEVRTHENVPISVAFAMSQFAYYPADQDIVGEYLVRALRKYSSQIGMASRRSLFQRVLELDHKTAVQKQHAEFKTFDPYGGQIGHIVKSQWPLSKSFSDHTLAHDDILAANYSKSAVTLGTHNKLQPH